MNENVDTKDYIRLEDWKRKVRRHEEEAKSQPDKKDLEETIEILKDFGIRMPIENIPHVNSVAALERWRKKIIKRNLE